MRKSQPRVSAFLKVGNRTSTLVGRAPKILAFLLTLGVSGAVAHPILNAEGPGYEDRSDVGRRPTRDIEFDADGTVRVSSLVLPPSVYASAEARQSYITKQRRFIASMNDVNATVYRTPTEALLAARVMADSLRRDDVVEMRKKFDVEVKEARIAGVPVHVVEPRRGIAKANATRVLINLHGGGFRFGAVWEGQLGSIPIASRGKIRVITIDYRMAPEYQFPSASEDVAAVYHALLKTHQPGSIGIYGCSAGAILTAESVAWFAKLGLPRPGAIGLDSGGALAEVKGDSLFLGQVFLNGKLPSTPPPKRGLAVLDAYFGSADTRNSMVSPAFSLSTLSRFPPTILINSTRDPTMSGALFTYRQLKKAGVNADLNIWEGVHHCFTYEAGLPEAQEAYEAMWNFFDRHLSK